MATPTSWGSVRPVARRPRPSTATSAGSSSNCAAVVGLHETGHAARYAPAAKLAELLVLQGRLEEAEPIVGSDEDSDSLLVRARLALAKDDAALATTLASRVSRCIGGDLLVRVAALSVSVDAHLAIDDLAGAAEEVGRLRTLANGTTSGARARAAIGEGRLALATGDGAEAAVGSRRRSTSWRACAGIDRRR